MGSSTKLKPVYWVGSSREDLKALPAPVIRSFGYGLFLAQRGERHPGAKSLRGFGSASVVELIEDWRGNTYRAVYTVRLADGIYVLHAFQKKSKRGIETPKADLNLIKARLSAAMRYSDGKPEQR